MRACAATLSGFLLAAGGLALPSPSTAQTSIANPMTYAATVVTDIRIGTHRFHNAVVTLTFVGSANDITPAVDGQGQPIPSVYCSGGPWFYWLTKGSARVKVESQASVTTAHLADGQVFVALDACNGGIGFGSYVGQNGLEPAYPLAFTVGTAEVVAITSGLWSPAFMTGDAWSCIGYPPNGAGNLKGNGLCAAPDSYPLQSDAGEVFFYQLYNVTTPSGTIYSNHNGSLNRGTFAIRAGGSE